MTFDLNIYFNSLHPHCVAQFFSMDWGRRTGGRDWTVLNVLCLSFFVAPAPMFSLFHKRATVFSLFHKKATNWTPTSETSIPSKKTSLVKNFICMNINILFLHIHPTCIWVDAWELTLVCLMHDAILSLINRIVGKIQFIFCECVFYLHFLSYSICICI